MAKKSRRVKDSFNTFGFPKKKSGPAADPARHERALQALGKFEKKSEFSEHSREKAALPGGLAHTVNLEFGRMHAKRALKEKKAESDDWLEWLEQKPFFDIKARTGHTKQGLVSYLPENTRAGVRALVLGKSMRECTPGLNALEAILSSNCSANTKKVVSYVIEKLLVLSGNTAVKKKLLDLIKTHKIQKAIPAMEYVAFFSKQPEELKTQARSISFKLRRGMEAEQRRKQGKG